MSNADTLTWKISQEIGFDVIHTLNKHESLQIGHIQPALCTAEQTRAEYTTRHGHLSNQITKTWDLLQQQILETKTKIEAINKRFKKNEKAYDNRAPVKKFATLKKAAEREKSLSENATYKTGKKVEHPVSYDGAYGRVRMMDEELPDLPKRKRAKIAHKKLLVQIKEQRGIVSPIIKEYNKIFRLLDGQLDQTKNRLNALQKILEDLKQENCHLDARLPTPEKAHQVDIDYCYSTKMNEAHKRYKTLLFRLMNSDGPLKECEKFILILSNSSSEQANTVNALKNLGVFKEDGRRGDSQNVERRREKEEKNPDQHHGFS